VLVESFGLGDWPAGRYVVQVTVNDAEAGQEVSQEFPMAIVDPAPPVLTGAETTLDSDPCSRLDLEIQMRLAHYLLTPQQEGTMKSLTPEGQRAYLERYWQERDPDPATRELENRRTMYERYLYANDYFSLEDGKTDGWSTERGRVLMVYGHPDRLEDYVHPTKDYPCQLWWYYSIKDGAVFVFRDTRGFGEFRLVHSNLPGELFNADWDEAIKTGELRMDE
jgi:GWxTD domain-containing protein